jgi:hypothetical protein
VKKLIVHDFREFERQEPITEDYIAGRSQNIYQGPSHHDTMDNLREDFRKPVLVLKWQALLIAAVLFAGAVVTLVAILRDLQP